MKKTCLFLVILLVGTSSVFAAKNYDEKYEEALREHFEVSGTIARINALVNFAYQSESMSRKNIQEIELFKSELPNILSLLLKQSYMDNVSLKELKRYNRAMNKPAVRKFKNSSIKISEAFVDNIDHLMSLMTKYIEKKLEERNAMLEVEINRLINWQM